MTVLLTSCGTCHHAFCGDDIDHDVAYRMVQEGTILPLETIISKHVPLTRGRILEVSLERKRERTLYEIEFVGDDGQVWEWLLDARTGQLVSKKFED